MRANQGKDYFIWQRFLHVPIGAVIVLPSPHGNYKNGVSYSDACAAGEIYAKLRKIKKLDMQTPDLLGGDISKNIILIAGKKANPIAKDFQSSKEASLNFCLEDGVIYDKEKQVLVTTQYIKGAKRTIDNVIVDYGLIVYTSNPFGPSSKVLHLAGIKGCGTLAAAIAVSNPGPVYQIEKLLRQLRCDEDAQLKDCTVEILVKASVTNGRVERESLQIEKIRVRKGRASRGWESKAYQQLKRVVPHRLYIHAGTSSRKTPSIRASLDGEEIKFAKSADRLSAIYFLAKQAREDYLNESENEGWISALELAQQLWQIRVKGNGEIELTDEIKREVAGAIQRWASNMVRRGKLSVSNDINLDHDYINSEILTPDLEIKKKIVDLVHAINHEEKNKHGQGFQLIESKPGLGYRLNLHPALVFITETSAPNADAK